MNPRPGNPLIVALDVSDVEAAERVARRLDGEAGIPRSGSSCSSPTAPRP